MLALKIIGAIVLIITLINLIAVGVDVSYADGEAVVSAKVMGRLIQIFPKPARAEKKPGKEKKHKKKKESAAQEKPGDEGKKSGPPIPMDFSKDEIVSLLKVSLRAAGRFRRKLCVDRFKFWFVSSDPDPYLTVKVYNYVNGAICTLGALAESSLRVKNSDIRTATDFAVGENFIEFGFAMSIRIGQIVGIGISAGFAAVKILIRHKRKQKKLLKQQLAA